MGRRGLSLRVVVAGTLVTVTTLLLGAFGLARYLSDRDEKYTRLRRASEVEVEVLSDSLALPIWNIDRAQSDKILEGMGPTQSIQAVVVNAAGGTLARVRIGGWLMPSDGKIATAGLLMEERPIVFNNQRIGTVRLYATPKFIQAELRRSLIVMVAEIVALDALLVLCVYFVLWRSVLRPLLAIEEYAVAVSSGRQLEAPAIRPAFTEELEALRASIEAMVRGLLEGELRFRTIFDSAHDAIFLTEPATGRIRDVNARITEMFGYTRDEAVTMDIGQLGSGVELHAESGPRMFEWHARHRDGHLFWVEGSMRLATIDGRPHLIVVVRDVTRRKEMESALNAEKEFTEAAIDSIPGIFFVRDRSGRLVRWNKALQRIRDVNDETLRAQMGLPVVFPEDRPVVERGIRDVFEHGRGEGRARVVVNGEVRDFLLNARRMERDGEEFLVGTGIDITDRQRAQEERERLQALIEQSATEWRQTFDSVQTPIIITDQHGVVRRLNKAAVTLVGADAATIPGRNVAELGSGPWNVAASLIAAFGDGRASAEARDAAGRVWDVTATRLFSVASDHWLILVFWEITGIVALQESLRRSERMSSMGALVAGVAHEVRNPLFGMSALLDAYAEELGRHELAEFSAGLRQQVIRLTHLMRELLEFGRPGSVTLVPGALHEVVEDAIGSRAHAAAEAKVTLENAVADGLPRVPMDHARLRQVFENLIDNALQHAPAVHQVTVSAREIVHAGQPSIECAVEDDGKGFFPDDLRSVFEPFFTRRERGTGLGLSIVQRIVEEHSGQVRAGNRAGGGAAITMVLPVVAPAPQPVSS